MSNAKPMQLEQRLTVYLGHHPTAVDREWDLTPRQRRRGWHKAHRSGERSGRGDELWGRKGRPTPRQRKPRRDG